MASPLIKLSAPPSLWDSMAAVISSSIHSDGWLRTSLVAILWRSADITFLPLLSSSTRVSARDGVDEEEGGGSGPNVFLVGVVSGEEV